MKNRSFGFMSSLVKNLWPLKREDYARPSFIIRIIIFAVVFVLVVVRLLPHDPVLKF